jgi:uncharacterized protein GlcG (DUF336 family)
MSKLNVIRWLREKRRREDDARPRTPAPGFPEVEQFERRFCLGTVAASALSEWATAAATIPWVNDDAQCERVMTAELATADLRPPRRPEFVDAQAPAEAATYGSSKGETPPAAYVEAPPVLVSSELASPLTAVVEAGGRATTTAAEPFDAPAAAAGTTVQLAESGAAVGVTTAIAAAGFALTGNGATTLDVGAESELAAGFDETPRGIHGDGPLMVMGPADLSASEVQTLLSRAAGATSTEDAIIAVVDRNGRILGVRVEDDVLAAIPDMDTLVFAIDGAVAKARTAAMFSSDQAPLTSRTVRFISQSTITEREVESNPNVDNASAAAALASTVRGPGFVAPIGVGGHFPPEVLNTPLVDLFGIEHTNRDSNLHPGPDGVKGTADDITLRTNADGTGRFNIDPAFVPAGQGLFAPESYGSVQNSGLLPEAQARGIATLPGGIPLFRDTDLNGFGDTLIGGIGVFFPGADGFATHEQGFVPGIGQTEAQRTNAAKVLEAEYIAFAAAGGSLGATSEVPGAKIGAIAGLGPVSGLDLPNGRIDLVGITLESIGPVAGKTGLMTVLNVGAGLGEGDPNSGADQPLLNADLAGMYRNGMAVPDGYLVTPHDSTDGGLTAAQVDAIIQQGILAAEQTRAAIRLPLGSRTSMVLAVTDANGEVLGLYRMPDATTFSLDVAVAKARNVAYYADAADLQAIDQVPGIAAGTAFTNRTFRFLAQPRFPSGIDGTPPPEFSILNDGSINDLTAENEGAPAPVSAFDSVYGHDAFFPGTNFRDPGDPGVVAAAGADQTVANQNGIVFFPGSTPLYINGQLVGGLGVSGDGVDQDDVVTFLAAQGFLPDATIVRSDQTFYRGVRLPYQKFLRNPFG